MDLRICTILAIACVLPTDGFTFWNVFATSICAEKSLTLMQNYHRAKWVLLRLVEQI